MGMAAGQARLLSITSRLSDNELRAQIINNDKMRLATKSSQVSEAYVQALNDAQMMFTNYDANNNASYQQLTFNALTSYNQYNNQYAISNLSGQVLVSENDAKNYAAANGDLNTFLSLYGLEYSTSYFDSLATAYGAGGNCIPIGVDGDETIYSEYSASELQAMYEGKGDYEGYNNILSSVEYYDYISALSSYTSTSDAYYLTIADQIDDKLDSLTTYDGLTLDDLETQIAGATDVSAAIGLVGDLQEFLTNSLYDLSNDAGKEYWQTLSDNLEEVISGTTTYDASNSICKDSKYYLSTYDENDIENDDDYILIDTSNSKATIYSYSTETTTTSTTQPDQTYSNVTYTKTTEDGVTTETLTDTYGNIVLKILTDEDGNQIITQYEYDADGNQTITNEYEPKTTSDDTETTTYVPTAKLTKYNNEWILSISDETTTEKINENKQDCTISTITDNGTTYYEFTCNDDDGKTYTYSLYNAGTDNWKLVAQTDPDLEEIQYEAQKVIDSIRYGIYTYFDIDSDEYKSNDEYLAYEDSSIKLAEVLLGATYDKTNDGYYYFTKEDGRQISVPVSDLSLFDDISYWENNYTKYANTELLEKISQIERLDAIMDLFGEPAYAWIDTNNPNENGDAKAQWYTNLFNRMQSGYQVLQDGLASSAEWIKFAFESGLVTLEQIDADNNWNSLIYSSCSDITEQTDNAAITLAEAEYNTAMNKIEAKDKMYDLQLKNIDTEHNSLQTEYDSIKNAVDKNIERTFKLYS